MEWKVDINELVPFLGRTIYRAENVLVELSANSYDADAKIVDISTSGESQQILIKDDGCGMDLDDLDEMLTITKSKKRDMISKGETTPIFHRRLLGSFGIGIISFFALGDFIRIFTRKAGGEPIYVEIKKVVNEETGRQTTEISELDENEKYSQHLLVSEHGTTLEVNNNKLNILESSELIRHKLTNLPLSDDFMIKLNGLEIKKEDFPEESWLKKEFSFTLENIDPTYNSDCVINVNYQDTIPQYKRGVFLTVNDRVIEHDLYSMIYTDLTSPGTIGARVRGFIKADYLEKSIQANRESFFDSEIINEIGKRIRDPLNQTILDYLEQRTTSEKEEKYNQLLQRVENARNKYAAPNEYLKKLGINFTSNPEYEQEVVLIIAQLCQKGLLPFQILDYNSGSHIDCVVKWPLSHTMREPDFISTMEIETTLDHFFEHGHDFRVKPDICCWEIRQADLERKKRKYMQDRPESMVEIELKDGSDKSHFGHQRELHFVVKDSHNVLTTIILKVYIISEIVETLCSDI